MAPAVIGDFTPADSVPEAAQSHANRPHTQLFSLSRQTIAVTGGGRGLGITLAAAIVEAGGNVVCLDILSEPSPDEFAYLQKSAKKAGLAATYARCDITNEEEVSTILETIAAQGHARSAPFSGIIACAGIQQQVPVTEYPVDDFERILRVNVTGTFLTAKHSSRIFIREGISGSIVLVASMSGQIANRGLYCSAYNASKSAVHQLCRSMAQEIGVHGIRINTLSPGYIRTAMTDELLAAKPEVEKLWMAGALLGRLGAPADFKAPAIFLLAPGSAFMTGSDLRVDGGHCASA